MKTKNTHGGERVGAGRPEGTPKSTHQFNVEIDLILYVKKLYGVKVVNKVLIETLVNLAWKGELLPCV